MKNSAVGYMLGKHYKKLFCVYVLFCCGMLLVCAGCEKTTVDKGQTKEFEIDKEYQRGPLTVHVRVDKTKATIAETILLELEATVEPGFEAQMPKVDKVLENFGIVEWDNLGDKLDENNNVVSRYRYRLEPFLSGTFAIPAFTFQFTDVNSQEEKTHELTTEPINIEVTSLLGEQRAELKIADIEGVVNVPTKSSYWWIWLLILSGTIAAVIFWFHRRSQQGRELVRIFKPAHEIAYERLRSLIEQDLVKTGKIKEFYERISDIFRHYIEHRFNLKAPERTTEEFLAELSSANVLAKQDREHLAEFLQHCDLVKFAKYDPTTEQIQKTFDLVKDFIETTKSDEKKIDVTEIESEKVMEVVSA
ncbi:MAG: hypothetical protein DRP62_00320 [Planctomycetota bacterium]|nr:MAG: hypothetical protein DRP62_00320 [Planctomycetota bacterium]